MSASFPLEVSKTYLALHKFLSFVKKSKYNVKQQYKMKSMDINYRSHVKADVKYLTTWELKSCHENLSSTGKLHQANTQIGIFYSIIIRL